MKCPYSQIELAMAMLSAAVKLEAKFKDHPEELKKFMDEGDGKFVTLKDEGEMDKVIAESKGLTVEALIASPDYKTFRDEFCEARLLGVLEHMKTGLGFTDVQAWALMYSSIQSMEG